MPDNNHNLTVTGFPLPVNLSTTSKSGYPYWSVAHDAYVEFQKNPEKQDDWEFLWPIYKKVMDHKVIQLLWMVHSNRGTSVLRKDFLRDSIFSWQDALPLPLDTQIRILNAEKTDYMPSRASDRYEDSHRDVMANVSPETLLRTLFICYGDHNNKLPNTTYANVSEETSF